MDTQPAQVLFDELSRLERDGGLDREAFVRLGAEIIAAFSGRPAHEKAGILESIRTYAPDEDTWEALRSALITRGLLLP